MIQSWKKRLGGSSRFQMRAMVVAGMRLIIQKSKISAVIPMAPSFGRDDVGAITAIA
jgi:hypothetical protein